VKLLSDQYLDG